MDLGSTPGSASISCLAASGSTPDTFAEKQPDARVVKLVDTRDLKSLAGNSVPVQVRPRAPFIYSQTFQLLIKKLIRYLRSFITNYYGKIRKNFGKDVLS